MANRGNLRKQNKTLWVFLVLAVVGVVFLGMRSQSLSIPGEPSAPPVQEVNPTQFTQNGQTLCTAGVSRVVTTFNAFDLKNQGTATGERHTVWYVNDDGSLSYYSGVNDIGTLDMAPGKKFRVMFGNYSEQTAVGFYPKMSDILQSPCDKGTNVVNGYNKDKNSSAITSSFYNSDDGLINTGADLNAISASGQSTVGMKLAVSAEDYFGDGKVVIVFNVNNTAFTDLKLTGGSAKVADVPRQHTGVVGARSYAFELPELASSNLNDAVYAVTLTAGTTEPTISSNVTCTIYDQSWFINAKDNLPYQGYQDEDSNDVGSPNAGGTAPGCSIGVS